MRNKEEGITKLDPNFAVALDKMMQASPYDLGINSAYRSKEAQACANPSVKDSSHMHGCAVDLGYGQDSCSSKACQWVVKNAPAFGLQIRMKAAPEWNHLEPIGFQECKAKTPGGGVTPTGAKPENSYHYAPSGDTGSTATQPQPGPANQEQYYRENPDATRPPSGGSGGSAQGSSGEGVPQQSPSMPQQSENNLLEQILALFKKKEEDQAQKSETGITNPVPYPETPALTTNQPSTVTNTNPEPLKEETKTAAAEQPKEDERKKPMLLCE